MNLTKGQGVELETLVAQCRAGDELAWEALVRRLQGRVYSLAYHYLRDREEARDVAQEAFIRLYRGLPRYDDAGSFPAWVARITRNCAIDRLRRLKVVPTHAAEPVEAVDAPGQQATALPDPESAALAGQRVDQLRAALDGMSSINREIIELKELHGLELREIADMLSIPLGTVKARSHRARIELASRMLQLDPSYGSAS